MFEKRIKKQYEKSRDLLLNTSSYENQNIDFKNVHLFISFLESTLKKPYNRLRNLSVFISDPDHLRTDLMYPFFLLSAEIKKSIDEKESEAVRLATALSESEIDCGYEALWKEEHLIEKE